MAKIDLDLHVRTLPDLPGVYKYFDEDGEILYVGKAKNLKKRVSSYFVKNQDSAKTRILVRKIAKIEYIVVDTELDALLLENNLIKKYRPRYNVLLKDDKTYPWICVKNEPFPRVFSTRRVIKDGSSYFGPYPSGRTMHAMLDLIRETYTLRTCRLDLQPYKINEGKFKECLEYHIGNCKAPCIGKQSVSSYEQDIEEIKQILRGDVRKLLRDLKKQMTELAEKQEFEEAHRIKLRWQALENYRSKSAVVSAQVRACDVLTLLKDDSSYFVNYLVIKDGAIIHGYTAEFKPKLDESEGELAVTVLSQLQERFHSQSKEVLLDKEIEEWPFEDIKMHVPQRGEKRELVELSMRNAKFYKLEKRKQEKIVSPEKHTIRILNQIQKDFRTPELPVHMECFDNSNLQGTNAVSACVVFKNAKPSKKDYRHFNIKTVEGPDDFASMTEVIFRRYKRLVEEGQSLPQLVIIDGGKGQLSAAMEAVEQLGLRGKMVVVGIAKRLEEIFFPGDQYPIYLDKRSESLKVVQHMRNEAHRFGITHHRNKRSKSALQSTLLDLSGVGPKTQEKLIRHFKSLKRLTEASQEDIQAQVGEKLGESIYKQLHP